MRLIKSLRGVSRGPRQILGERRSLSATTKGGRQASQGPPTPPWLWLLLIGGFGLIFWQFVPNRPGPQPAPEPMSRIWVVVIVGVPAVLILAAVALQLLRNFDPGIRRAQKRSGREIWMGQSPTSASRSKRKGRIKTASTRWAYSSCVASIMTRPSSCFARLMRSEISIMAHAANLGLALLKAGKPAEAIPVFQEAARLGPQAPLMTCVLSLHTAMALADLNRWDEAEKDFSAPKMRPAACAARSRLA